MVFDDADSEFLRFRYNDIIVFSTTAEFTGNIMIVLHLYFLH